jgi:hypothetical protein
MPTRDILFPMLSYPVMTAMRTWNSGSVAHVERTNRALP